MTLQIQSNHYFIKVGESNLYAAQEWVRQGSSGSTVGGLPLTQQNVVPLKLYWNAEREDNFSASTILGEQDALANGYQLIGIEGYVFSNQEPGTVPLKLYFNAQRGDYFTTATPQGEQDALGSGYQFIRIEGYVFQSETQHQGIVPLKLFWHGGRGDNATTANPGSEQRAYAAGYQYVRFAGYVLRYP